jgi:hypothetical protein
MRTTFLHRLGPVGLALLLPIGAAACTPSDQERAEQTSDSVSDEAQRSADHLGQKLDSVGDDARQRTQNFADQLRDGARDVREAAARNGVSSMLAGEFQRHGVTLDGTPTCAASSEQIGQYHIECYGPTTDGRTANLVGDDPGGDSPGNFVGSVDGQEVFRQECVGLC